MTKDHEQLVNYINNDQRLQKTVCSSIKGLKTALDTAARQCARANAEYNDDPEDEDYELDHLPAIRQFPKGTRKQAIVELLEYYLFALSLQYQD